MPHPIALSSDRLLPEPAFSWIGKPKFKTNLNYSIRVYQLKPSKDDRGQHAFLHVLHHQSIEIIKEVFPNYFNQIRLGDRRTQSNDRIWSILLRFPPSHRIEITAHCFRRRKLNMGDRLIVRPIFAASLNLRGFSRNSSYTSRLMGRVLSSIVSSSTSNHLLIHSKENDELYFQAILACGRNLLSGK